MTEEQANRIKPLLFIIATLAAWSFIIVLANVAVTCVPGGDACSAAGPFTPTSPSRSSTSSRSSGLKLWVCSELSWLPRSAPHFEQ